jgi:hypothetical protein
MQDAEFTIHDCNTKIKLNAILLDIHGYFSTKKYTVLSGMTQSCFWLPDTTKQHPV